MSASLRIERRAFLRGKHKGCGLLARHGLRRSDGSERAAAIPAQPQMHAKPRYTLLKRQETSGNLVPGREWSKHDPVQFSHDG